MLRLPISVKLSSHDPTALLEKAQAWVYVQAGNARQGRAGARSQRRQAVRQGQDHRAGSPPAAPRWSSSTARRQINRGKYRVKVTARKAGCRKPRSKGRSWNFSAPSLPVRALPYSTKVNDNVGVVRFALRPIRRSKRGPGPRLADQLERRHRGRRADTRPRREPGRGRTADQRANSAPATTRSGWSARSVASDVWRSLRRRASASSAAAASAAAGRPDRDAGPEGRGGLERRQVAGPAVSAVSSRRASVSGRSSAAPTSSGSASTRRTAGAKSAMMTWTDKDWGTFREVALREAKYANGTGPDFREGMNKFGPTEKWSRGSFQGIISDRGPIEGPGGGSLAPPTTYDLNWEWDFSKPGKSSCHVEAVFRTETDQSDKPLARSAQIVWRGEANATPANARQRRGLPRTSVRSSSTCEAGPTGVRRLEIDNPGRWPGRYPRGLRRRVGDLRTGTDHDAPAQQRHALPPAQQRRARHGLVPLEGQRSGARDGTGASSRPRSTLPDLRLNIGWATCRGTGDPGNGRVGERSGAEACPQCSS